MRNKTLALVVVLLALGGIFGWIQLLYARVDVLTAEHGLEFSALVEKIDQRDSAPGSTVYYKVFEYQPDSAVLFIVDRDAENRYIGFYVFTSKTTGNWDIDDRKLVWASHGSADGWTWPPYGLDPKGVWRW